MGLTGTNCDQGPAPDKLLCIVRCNYKILRRINAVDANIRAEITVLKCLTACDGYRAPTA